jgi:hypothetical protein
MLNPLFLSFLATESCGAYEPNQLVRSEQLPRRAHLAALDVAHALSLPLVSAPTFFLQCWWGARNLTAFHRSR